MTCPFTGTLPSLEAPPAQQQPTSRPLSSLVAFPSFLAKSLSFRFLGHGYRHSFSCASPHSEEMETRASVPGCWPADTGSQWTEPVALLPRPPLEAPEPTRGNARVLATPSPAGGAWSPACASVSSPLTPLLSGSRQTLGSSLICCHLF